MDSDIKQRLDRQELVKLAILFAAGKNGNMPGQVKRILNQRFGIEVREVEVEAECAVLAGETVVKLAQAAQKVAA